MEKIYKSLLVGMLAAMIFTPILALADTNFPQNTIEAKLYAVPDKGTAPLTGVDLQAYVNGTYGVGSPITYQFDCNGDGIWDLTVTSNLNPYIATNLCNYQNAGTYSVRVLVIRGGLSTSDVASVTVSQGPSSSVSAGTSSQVSPTPTPGGSVLGASSVNTGNDTPWFWPMILAAVLAGAFASYKVWNSRKFVKG